MWSRVRKYAQFGVFYTKIVQMTPPRLRRESLRLQKFSVTNREPRLQRVNYDQSLLDDPHHGFALSRSADRHSYYPSRLCMHARTTYWKVWKWLFSLWYSTPNIPKWLKNLWSRSHTDSTHQKICKPCEVTHSFWQSKVCSCCCHCLFNTYV